jgi:signal transduction histidine kinase/DNA-binding response OmpR family regulator
MRRILILVYSAFLLIMLANYIYYRSLYEKQIKYITELLDRQVQIIGISVDNTNNSFISDLNQAIFSKDLALFFSDSQVKYRLTENMKLFFSKYQNFVTGIRYYDNNKNEFTLKKDAEPPGEWLDNTYTLHSQSEIFTMEKLVRDNNNFYYSLPVINDITHETIGNIVVTVDYRKYFSDIFSEFNFKDYQWQWVVSDSGKIVFDNIEKDVRYLQIDRITSRLGSGSTGDTPVNAIIGGVRTDLISAYYSTQLLGRELVLVFSAKTDLFQKYIIRNSLFIVLGTLLLIQIIIYLFWRFFKSQKSEMDRLRSSETMLFKLIEEMPVGVIIHNKAREILKANKVAAKQYSYTNDEEMKGKIFPETSLPDDNEYFSKNLVGTFNPDQFVIIKKEIGEIILYRNSIPIKFMGEDAVMEILIDVTMLESARKQEAKANVAKTEFLARMSYEIRTPLNGIIGMTDVLYRFGLSPEIMEIVSLLRRSTEVLLNIINDILDFSKIESGKMILDEVPFNLREEITYCSDLARTNMLQNKIGLEVSVDENVPESIIGDPFRLRQVITNLLNNSIKNTEKGEIRLRCMLKSNNSGIITLGFELLDTGKRYDKASLKKIFGDFVNIEAQSVRSSEESNFSTILAKQLVELMGGEFLAECPSGLNGEMGMKVTFTIITYSNDRQIKDLSLEKITTFSSIRVLVITGTQTRDEEILGALHKMGLIVRVTTYMKSTVNQIRENSNYPDEKYNLVIIFDDENFNGFDVAKSIWDNKLSEHFIMMMITSNDKKGNYMKCIMLGIDHYLIKPFDISDLVNVVKNSFPFIEDSASSFDIGTERNNINILIVEDNKMNQKVIGTMLKSLGYSFDIADDGYAGYLQAKTRKYDLIFMDLIMPEMDGYESAQKILSDDKSILIVAFTADNMPESKRKAEMSGIKDFISKPVRIDELKKLFARYFKN